MDKQFHEQVIKESEEFQKLIVAVALMSGVGDISVAIACLALSIKLLKLAKVEEQAIKEAFEMGLKDIKIPENFNLDEQVEKIKARLEAEELEKLFQDSKDTVN